MKPNGNKEKIYFKFKNEMIKRLGNIAVKKVIYANCVEFTQ